MRYQIIFTNSNRAWARRHLQPMIADDIWRGLERKIRIPVNKVRFVHGEIKWALIELGEPSLRFANER